MKNPLRYLRNLFSEILNDYGRVFVVVKHSENTVIGMRGFTEEEKKKGLTLVFSRRNFRDLVWTEDGSMQATLGFGAGNKPEKCFIHADDVVSVFSPDAKVKLDRWDVWYQQEAATKPDNAPRPSASESGDKIVSLDRFRKSKNW